MQITSPTNRHVAELRALHAAKGRLAAGAFLAEGPHVVAAAFDARVRPRLIVTDPAALERSVEGRRLVVRCAEARSQGVPVYAASAEAVARACDTQTPQGIVAAVALEDVAPERVRARRRGRARPVVVILDALADPGNVGAILRAALAADADEVWLSQGSADPYNPKVVRAASGAHFFLPLRAGLTWEEIAARLRGAPALHQVALAEAAARVPYDALDLTRRTALLIGNEAHGPSAEARRLATTPVSIPMWNHVESLNAAVAASVVLFEAARQRRARERDATDTQMAEMERVDGVSEQGAGASD